MPFSMLIDLTGLPFGRLTVIKRAPNKGKMSRWVCECICGTTGLIVYGNNLRHGRTQSCGCSKQDPSPRLIDLTGLPFGRLTVLTRAPDKGKKTCWVCACVCGNITTVFASALSNRNTQSCGCLRQETHSTHGLSRSVEYKIWDGMKGRCQKTRGKAYAWYKARGIVVCDRWQNSFENFYADMGPRPGPGYSIERKDNDGPYSPNNCVWATAAVQNRNRRDNHMITIDGQTACLKDWLHVYGRAAGTFDKRVKRGMSEEDALITPVSTRRKP